MATSERLHLDDIISSIPELGPTTSNNKHVWIVFISLMIVQITIPSIISMYGIILSYLVIESPTNFDIWKGEIALTPILFTAFYNLADPWTRIVINLASAPRIIGLIGVGLLSIGVLAAGYLATGGVGAYLASSSAGAVMGIGGSFVLLQADSVLRRHFRSHIHQILIFKEIASCLGFFLAPGLIYFILSSNLNLNIASLLMACVFIPPALGTLVYYYPSVRPSTSSYTLLVTEDDHDDAHENNNMGNFARNEQQNSESIPEYLFGEGSETYSYLQGLEDDQELFNVNSRRISAVKFEWKQMIRVMKHGKFWIGVITWIGCKASSLFIWIFLPSLVIISCYPPVDLLQSVTSSMAVAFGTVFPNIISFWKPKSARMRSLCFGVLSWLGCMVLLGLSIMKPTFSSFLVISFLGGISIGGTSIFLEPIMLDILDNSMAKKAHMIFSTIVGFSILCFVFIPNPKVCLQLTAIIQFFGGFYWLMTPIFEIIRARL